MEEITIDISKDGNSIKVEGHGISGPDCVALTKEIEQALGTVESQRLKAAFHQPRQVLRKAGA